MRWIVFLQFISGRCLYGAVTQIEGDSFITFEGTRIPKMYINDERDSTMLRLSSRPLPVPDDIDFWYVSVVY